MSGLSFKLGMESKAFEMGIAKAKSAVKGLGAVIAAQFTVFAIKSLIDDFDALGKRAKDLEMSASGFLALKNSAELAGVESEKLEQGLKSFAQRVAEDNEAFKKLGISVKDSNGNLKSTQDVLYETADRFKELKGSAEAADASWKLFGGDALELNRVMAQGSDAIKELSGSASSIDDAAEAAAEFNKNLNNVKQALFAVSAGVVKFASKTLEAGKYLATLFGAEFEETEKYVGIVERRRRAEMEASTKVALEEAKTRQALEEENKKLVEQNEKDKQKANAETAEIVKKYQWEQLSTEQKILAKKKEMKSLEDETRTLHVDSVEYALVKNEYAKAYVELQKLEKEHKKELLDLAEKEKKKAEDKKKLEKDLNDLYTRRADIVNEVLRKQQDAQKANLERIGASGATDGDIKKSVDKAKSYEQKAEKAFGEGRMSDYNRLKRQQEKAEQRALEKQKEKLERAGADALKRGDKDSYDRLKKEYEKAGQGDEKKTIAEAVKEIDEKIKEMKDNIAELVGGLKEG